MPVFDPSMTADKVASMLPGDALNISGHDSQTPDFVATKGYIDARRKGSQNRPKYPPQLDINKPFLERRVRIFNVGPFAYPVNLGSTGIFFIQACPEDKPYIESLTPLHELVQEYYPARDKREPMKLLQDEGRKIAVEILGEGRNQDKRQSKRHTGVFIAAGDVPTTKELEDARAELKRYASAQIAIMDQLWDRDRKLAYDVFRPQVHGVLARVLGLTGKDKAWLAQGASSDMIECPACKTSVRPDAAFCFNCKEVVNEDAYLKVKARRDEIAAKTKKAN
jgi:hypothetical protein